MSNLAKYLAERYGAGPEVAPSKKKKKSDNSKKATGQKIVDADAATYVPHAKLESKKVRFDKPSLGTYYDEEEDEDMPAVVTEDGKDVEMPNKKQSMGTWVTIDERNADEDPPRKSRHDSDDDEDPPRKSRHDSDDDEDPPRKSRHDSDDDEDPPRKSRHDSDEDQSPPRKSRHDSDDEDPPRKSRHDSDDDEDPPRKSRHDSDDDQSPPRKSRHDSDDEDQSPPRKDFKMSDGGSSGLVNPSDLKSDLAKRKREQDDRFAVATDEQTGKGAATVIRDKRGRKLEALSEMLNKEKGVQDEAQMVWGRGLVQLEEQLAKQQEIEEAMQNPNYSARYADDSRMNDRMKDVDRWGDPMAGKIQKKSKMGIVKPTYKGAWPPNRFNIPPGFRWDGVVRGTGFEKKYFEKQSQRQATGEAAYKWSTSDM